MTNTFDNIAGYKEEKKELQDICNIIQRREELRLAGGKLPKGIFLVGPNGVGKTKLAKAFIQESKCKYVEVKANDSVTAKFKEASEKTPCILFIDELDKYAGLGMMDHIFAGDSTRSQDLLNEINKYNDVDGIFLLLIANSEASIDKAIIRSGRVDKKIRIDYPTESEREEIIKYYFNNKKYDKSVNFSNLARITERFSGADLESLINDALIRSIINKHQSITNKDILSTYNDKVFSCKEKDSELSNKNQKMLAYHEAGHAAIALLNDKNSVFYASIMPRGNTKGFVGEETNDKKLKTVNDIKKYIKTCLAGLAAEEIFLKQRTMGSLSDIEKARENVKNLVRTYGALGFDKLNLIIKCYEFDNGEESCSEHKKRKIEEAEDKLFNSLYESTKKLLVKNKELVKEIADELLDKKILNKEDLTSIYKNFQKRKVYN